MKKLLTYSTGFFKGVLGTRFGSLESEKSGPYRSTPGT